MGQDDLLSLFFSRPDVFTEDFIIDELLDFFMAGSATQSMATQTIISHLCRSPDSLQKVRDEFNSEIE